MATGMTSEQGLLSAARDGDQNAFGRLVEPYRGQLQAHCYRMLGSLHDAEDAQQEALLRAWRGLARFEGRSSLKSWLYTIATNTCLNTIQRRPKRVLPLDYGPATDPHDGPGTPLIETVWVEPWPEASLALDEGLAGPEARYEQRESVELAFVAALQHLPANQRAALILREVLGFSAAEVAESLETSVASVNSALQRARKTIDDKLPERSQQETLRSMGDERVREVVEDYMAAMERGDVDAIIALLADDAAWSMPPLASWFGGPEGGLEAVRDFLRLGPMSGEWRWRRMPATSNGQPAIAAYTWVESEGCYLPFALDVLTFEGDRIKEVTAFITRTIDLPDPDDFKRWPEMPLADSEAGRVFARCGLPARLD